MGGFERFLKLADAERTIQETLQTSKWRQRIPYINFPTHWWVQVVYPEYGSMAQFYVKSHESSVGAIGILLDCHNHFGGGDDAYWSVSAPDLAKYYQFPLYQIREMVEKIGTLLDEIDKKPL